MRVISVLLYVDDLLVISSHDNFLKLKRYIEERFPVPEGFRAHTFRDQDKIDFLNIEISRLPSGTILATQEKFLEETVALSRYEGTSPRPHNATLFENAEDEQKLESSGKEAFISRQRDGLL